MRAGSPIRTLLYWAFGLSAASLGAGLLGAVAMWIGTSFWVGYIPAFLLAIRMLWVSNRANNRAFLGLDPAGHTRIDRGPDRRI
jgi:hypothetical protein